MRIVRWTKSLLFLPLLIYGSFVAAALGWNLLRLTGFEIAV